MMRTSRRIQQGPPMLRLAVLLVIGLSAVLFFPQQQQQQQQGVFAFSSRSSRILPNPSRIATVTGVPAAVSTAVSALAMTATTTATMLPEGLLKTIVTPGGKDAASNVRQGDYATIKYTCYAVPEVAANDEKTTDKRTTQANILLARSDSEKMVVGDGSMVQGWDAALRSMAVGERAIVRVTDPTLGYATTTGTVVDGGAVDTAFQTLGIEGLTSTSSSSQTQQLEFDIEILKIQTAQSVAEMYELNFDSIALMDDTPQTAADIAEAYERRMEQRAPDKEGLEYWVEKVQNYYFFGFFEGETGEEAPWYLKPSITFPIAFAIVGAAFYISLLAGAISEKGAQSIDELDVLVQAATTALLV